MKRMAPETEKKLLAAIEKTAELVAEGLSPNDAIVKAAAEGQLRPGDVNLVVHAYNTGQTLKHHREGRDPFEKSAEFEIANTTVVLEKLYPSTVKTAAAQQQSTTISPEYSYSPQPMLERKQRWERRAQAVDWRTLANGAQITPPEPLPTEPEFRFKQAMANASRLKVAAEEARRQKSSAFDELATAFNSLTSYFRRPDASPLPVVKEAVVLLHGGKGEQIMDQLVKVTPSLMKLSNHHTGVSLMGTDGPRTFACTVDDLDCTAEPFNLVADVLHCIDAYKVKSAACQAATARYTREAGEAIAPFDSRSQRSILGPSYDAPHEKAAKDGNFNPLSLSGAYSMVDNTITPIAQKIRGPDTETQVGRVVQELGDPDHEARLREISTQAMLHDLMANDESISGHDPDDVTAAFNDITQLAPSAADQRMLMQSLLRKRLEQGSLDTFEQSQLLGFEDNLRKRLQPAGGGDGSVI